MNVKNIFGTHATFYDIIINYCVCLQKFGFSVTTQFTATNNLNLLVSYAGMT